MSCFINRKQNNTKMKVFKILTLCLLVASSILSCRTEESELIETPTDDTIQPNSSIAQHVKIDQLNSSTDQKKYLDQLEKIKAHLQRGDIYEMNYCIQFTQLAEIHPIETYFRLNRAASAPFSVYANLSSHAIISASPERYIRKEGDKLISQPIKGTAKRSSSIKLW